MDICHIFIACSLTASVYYFLDRLLFCTAFLNLSPHLLCAPCPDLLPLAPKLSQSVSPLINSPQDFLVLRTPSPLTDSISRLYPWSDGGLWLLQKLWFLASFTIFVLCFCSDPCHLDLFQLSYLYIHCYILASSFIEYLEFQLHRWLVLTFHAPNFIKTLIMTLETGERKFYRKVGSRPVSFHKRK